MPANDVAESAREDLDLWRRQTSANFYEIDSFIRRLLQHHLGKKWAEADTLLRTVADQAGPRLDALARESNRDENLPRLRRRDEFGHRTEDIVFHPSYHDAGRVFWASGVLAALSEPGNEVLAGGIAYLLDQHGEAGHACPVACTAGAIKLIKQVGSADQKHRLLPGLMSADYDQCLRAAQFVTEVQGGSDVGSNSCRARADSEHKGWFRISGEKWFCSVADADLFVISARMDGAPSGTSGLGLFLVPRLIDGEVNGFQLHNLKYKLGTRSMATGEIEFDDAFGEAVGDLAGGFKNLVGIVLDTSRVHNAIAACGLARRALVEGHAYARHRRAFSNAIEVYPGVQEILARMKLSTMAALCTTFRILAMTDLVEAGRGDPELIAARRIAVMINKYWTAVKGTACTRDGIELLGGNGTIEDFSVLPRLYRDSIVVESWEGTHNTLCAQVLRDFSERGLHRSWLDHLNREIGALDHADLESHLEIARREHQEVVKRIDTLVKSDQKSASAQIRHVVDHMCRLTDWVTLATQLQWEKTTGIDTDTADALELYRLTVLEGADPQGAPQLIELNRRFSTHI
ncbi:MAG: acyl-CoA dehydrogenase family protein [Acidobacteria bacterium]|nr:acyl-CoA dehydrogenase family protein [Acidobacteriota bacterium]